MSKILVSALLFSLTLLAFVVHSETDSDPTNEPDVSTLADRQRGKEAEQVLANFIRLYEQGDFTTLRTLLDPGMIGYQRFLDGAARDSSLMKQLRIHLYDMETLSGPDVAVIRANWEKRFFSVSNYQPGLLTGRTTVLLHRNNDVWKLVAISGDNLFSSQSGTQGQINIAGTLPLTSIPACVTTTPAPVTTCTPGPQICTVTVTQVCTGPTIPPECTCVYSPVSGTTCTRPVTSACVTGSPGCACVPGTPVCTTTTPPPATACPTQTVPFTIEIIDPDLVGQRSVSVLIRSSGGDRETLVLAQTTPGRFVAASIAMQRLAAGQPASGNGIVEVQQNQPPITMTIEYMDQNPGNNRPPSMLWRSFTLR